MKMHNKEMRTLRGLLISVCMLSAAQATRFAFDTEEKGQTKATIFQIQKEGR